MVVFDNIIFSLQHAGGISSMWKQIICAAEKNSAQLGGCKFIEYQGATDNIFRSGIRLPASEITERSSLMLGAKRYLNPKLSDIKEPFVFHSSYYRYCTNPLAINVTTVHDFIYERHVGGLAAKIHSWQKRAAVQHSQAIICVSESTKADLIHFYADSVDPGKIFVVPNCIDPCFLSSPDIPAQAPGNNILFVGSRAGYKNFEALVKAISPLTDFNLRICGHHLSEPERRMLNSCLGESRYCCIENPSTENLAEEYKNAFCTIYPSKYEGFGIPVLEAQACGCPVLANNTPALAEVIGNQSLLLNEISTHCVAQGLDIIRANRAEIVSRGRQNASRFTPQATTETYINIYKQLIQNPTT